jgi:transposase
VATHPREAQSLREQARILVTAIGYEETATRLQIKAATLRQWAKRYNWNGQVQHKQAIVTTVTKPSDALQDHLADLSKRSRIGFAKAAATTADHVAEMKPQGILARSRAIRDMVGVAETVHGWRNEEGKGQGIMPSLNIYSKQTVIGINQGTETPTPQ